MVSTSVFFIRASFRMITRPMIDTTKAMSHGFTGIVPSPISPKPPKKSVSMIRKS